MIRKHSFNDIPQIVALETEVLGTTLGEKMLEMALRNEMAFYYVYEEKKRILGYISTMFDGEIIEILNFCVRKDCQHQGIGTKLLAYAFTELYAKGAKSSILEVRESNQNAISLYSKMGYKKISVRKAYYENGENALVLQRTFDSTYDLETAYDSEFSKREETEGYIHYSDDIQPDKYYNNYFWLKDIKALKNVQKVNNRNFLLIQTELGPNRQFDGFEPDPLMVLAADIRQLELHSEKNYSCHRVGFEDYATTRNFIYESNLRYGAEFARKNADRFTEAFISNPKFDCYVVTENEKIIGMIHTYIFHDIAKMEGFFVLDAYQKKGFGTCLFQYALEELKKKEIHMVELIADREDYPVHVYEKWGFKGIREIQTYFKEIK